MYTLYHNVYVVLYFISFHIDKNDRAFNIQSAMMSLLSIDHMQSFTLIFRIISVPTSIWKCTWRTLQCNDSILHAVTNQRSLNIIILPSQAKHVHIYILYAIYTIPCNSSWPSLPPCTPGQFFIISKNRELDLLIGIPQNVYKSQPGFWL